MISQIASVVLIATLASGVSAWAQSSRLPPPLASRFVDAASGLSLEAAIARAIEQEPSLRAVRSQVAAAEALRQQAALRPNPSVSVERRTEPGGSDSLTTAGVQWPLDLFRRRGRVAVADQEVAVARIAVADRQRVLAADVRTRYGEVLATVRELSLFDELVTATERQYDVLRARVEEGAAPAVERDVLDVELRRLRAERLLQAARTETAVFELKRVLGMKADAAVTVRETLEERVQRENEVSPPAGSAFIAADQRTDVRQAEAQVAVAEAKIARARAQGRFDVSVFANYMRMDAAFPQRAFSPTGSLEPIRGQFNYLAAGAALTIPVNRNQGEVAAAHAERTGAAASYDAAQLAAEADVASARTRDEYARQAVALFTSGAQGLARQNLAVLAQSYELGRVTVFDVMAERRRYLDVERAYTDALRAAFEARTALQRALGDVQ